MQITARETDTYTEALSLPQYGEYSPGERYAPVFASMAAAGASVLDAGCGTGKGMVALAALGFDVTGCDLTTTGLVDAARRFPVHGGVALWRDVPLRRRAMFPRQPMPYDYVYCTDVLEHVPPVFTMLVVATLLRAAARGLFLSIALTPDAMGVWVGRTLHLSVRRYDEWLADFQELARVTDARDLGVSGLYFLEPRR